MLKNPQESSRILKNPQESPQESQAKYHRHQPLSEPSKCFQMLPDAPRYFRMLQRNPSDVAVGKGWRRGGVNSTFADVRRMFDGRWIKMIDRRHRPPSSLLPPSSLPPPHLRGHCHPHPPPYLPLLPSATQSSFIRPHPPPRFPSASFSIRLNSSQDQAARLLN